MNSKQINNDANPEVKDVQGKDPQGKASSKHHLKSAADELQKINESEKIIREKSKAAPLNKKALASIASIFLILLLPFPKNVGGEIEIEGTPAANQAFLRPMTNGIVEEIFVRTGQQVNPGQKIALLRNWDLEEKILNGEKELSRLESSIGSLRAQEKVSRAEYQRAFENYKRNRTQSEYLASQTNNVTDSTLPARLSVTKNELDKVELQTESLINKAALHKYLAEKEVYPSQMAQQSEYEAAASDKQAQSLRSELTAQKEELSQNSKVEGLESSEALMGAQSNLHRAEVVRNDMKAAQSQIKDMRNLLNLYKEQKDSLSLTSPIQGTVLTLKADSLIGQNFNKGDNVIVVGNLDAVKVKLQLPEQEIAYVKPGQDATVRFIGIPDKAFKGKVDQIAPVTSEVNEQITKKRIFEITVNLSNKENLFKPGMTGYATIYTGTWRSLLAQAWDETYRIFKLDRYINRNPFSQEAV